MFFFGGGGGEENCCCTMPGFADELHLLPSSLDGESRFGWVNASYVYGLQIVDGHMRRALGTLTPYPTFIRAVERNREKALADLALPHDLPRAEAEGDGYKRGGGGGLAGR